MKAEEFLIQWLDKKYDCPLDAVNWTGEDVVRIMNDFAESQHPTPTLTDSMIEDIFYLNFAKFFCTVDDEKHCIEAMEYIRDFMQSGEANSEFELQRLYDWLMDEKRKPANTAFTSGITRNVAREIEFRLAQSGEALGAKEKKILLRAITWLNEDVEEGNERAIEIQAGLKDILNKSGEAPQECRFLTYEDDNLLERLDSCLAQVEMPSDVNNEYEAVRELISNRLSKTPQESKGDGIDALRSVLQNLKDKHTAFIGNRKNQITAANAVGFKEGLAWAIGTIESAIEHEIARQDYLSTRQGEGDGEPYCDHAVTEQKNLRCTCCAECGEILDVID